MSAENAALVRRWFNEVWNDRRAETIDELLDDESVCRLDTGELRGPAAFRAIQFEPLVAAFPDARVKIEGIVAAGDEVVVRWSADATHTGEALGLAPTGRPIRLEGMSWITVRDGKFRQGYQWSNIPAVLAGLRQ
jgi:predicted ester cyclase